MELSTSKRNIFNNIFFCIVPIHRPRDLRTTAVTSSSVPAECKNNIHLRWPSSNSNDGYGIGTTYNVEGQNNNLRDSCPNMTSPQLFWLLIQIFRIFE